VAYPQEKIGGVGMIYAFSVLGLLIALWIWSMCRIAAKDDENFERLDQREQHPAELELTGTDDRLGPLTRSNTDEKASGARSKGGAKRRAAPQASG
jgi:hypothetical protein